MGKFEGKCVKRVKFEENALKEGNLRKNTLKI